MENLDFEELKNIVEGLMADATCPVCFCSLRSPVSLCTNGHGVCAKCKNSLKECPLCAVPYPASSSRSALLNSMLDHLPHTCQFQGCEEFVKPGDDHEKWCGYQITECKFFSCEWKGCGNNILDHFVTDHNGLKLGNTVNSNGILVVQEANADFFPSAGLALDRVFWIASGTNLHLLHVLFYFVPNGKIMNPLQVTLVMGDSERFYSSSFITTLPAFCLNEKNTMSFALLKVKDLANSEGLIPFKVTIEECDTQQSVL